MDAKGTVHKYGNNIDTDVIIPARYLNTQDIKELATHCMEYAEKDFAKKVKKGDIMVAGENFGCGSSREHAPAVIKECGISCVIASSFARIFYRNAINIGLPILECPEASRDIEAILSALILRLVKLPMKQKKKLMTLCRFLISLKKSLPPADF